MAYKILVLKGDGIGPEVVGEALQILKIIARLSAVDLEFKEGMIGGHALDTSGTPLPDDVIKHAQDSDAILLGAVGGPKWDNPNAEQRPEQALLGLRKLLGLFANVRPVKPVKELMSASPLKAEILNGVDVVIIRELTGGIYYGKPSEKRAGKDGREAVDTCLYTEAEITRVLKFGFEMARERRKKLTSVDKANVMASSRLWREIATELSAQFKDVAFENQLVDSMAMHLIRRPKDFDVVVTENMFGDILTDEASVLAGSMGLLPSASLGEELNSAGYRVGLYEPIHGSAPDIAGRDEANPLAAILSAAMLLEHSLGMRSEAELIANAVDSVVRDGYRTRDLHGGTGTQTVGCKAMGRLVREKLEATEGE
ncbi:MAG TPA: 3-isopropylmalate dehydrogenase [Methylomirabilota bacterium]|jgi:3-isopropylmalate dehydrogenase|nr:3-isopropylmalate dehydrogenase [Methylomirabilota bacterium]